MHSERAQQEHVVGHILVQLCGLPQICCSFQISIPHLCLSISVHDINSLICTLDIIYATAGSCPFKPIKHSWQLAFIGKLLGLCRRQSRTLQSTLNQSIAHTMKSLTLRLYTPIRTPGVCLLLVCMSFVFFVSLLVVSIDSSTY